MGIDWHSPLAFFYVVGKRCAAMRLRLCMIKGAVMTLAGLVCCAAEPGYASSRDRAPQFALRNPIARPDSGVVIVALNRAARRSQPLTIEYEGLKLPTAAPLLSKENGEFCWRFKPADLQVPAALLREGVHALRARHANGAWSEPLQIVWHSRPPLVTAEAMKVAGTEKVAITGRVASDIPHGNYQITVDLLLNIAQEPIGITLPLQRGADSAGMAIFTFCTAVQGLPQMLRGEAGLARPFLALWVADPAGNYF